MKHLVLLFVSLAISQGMTRPQSDSPGKDEAARILDAIEEKIASSEKRDALETLRIQGEITSKMLPVKGSFEELYSGRNRARWNFDYGVMGKQTQGTTGEMSWTTDPALGVVIKTGADQAALLRLYGISRLRSWKELYERAEIVGDVDLEGRPHVKVRMFPEDCGEDDEGEFWYIDREANVLSRLDISLPDPAGGVLGMEFQFAQWKDVGGYLIPHEKIQKVGEIQIQYHVEHVAINEMISPDRLTPPDDVIAAMKDPDAARSPSPGEPGTCRVVSLKTQHIASIRMEVDEAEISAKLAIMLPEVLTHIGKVSGQMAGPPMTRYHGRKDGKVDLEAGIPVRAAIEPGGRVKASTLPAGPAVSTWHVGPYHTMSQTYQFLEKWLEENEHEAREAPWEVYWTDPGLEPDPNNWKTEILWPIRGE